MNLTFRNTVQLVEKNNVGIQRKRKTENFYSTASNLDTFSGLCHPVRCHGRRETIKPFSLIYHLSSNSETYSGLRDELELSPSAHSSQ